MEFFGNTRNAMFSTGVFRKGKAPATPAPSSGENIRIGTTNASGTGDYDSGAAGCGPVVADGTYSLGSGEVVFTSDVGVFNGAQTAGTYAVGGRTFEVATTHYAVANQTEWASRAAGASLVGWTVAVRWGAALSDMSDWSYAAMYRTEAGCTISGDGAADLDGAAYHIGNVQLQGPSNLKLHNLAIESLECFSNTNGWMDNLWLDACVLETDKPDLTSEPATNYFDSINEPFYVANGASEYIRGLAFTNCKIRGSGTWNGVGSFLKCSRYCIFTGNDVLDFYGDGIRFDGASGNPVVIRGGNLYINCWGISTDALAPHPDDWQDQNNMAGVGIVTEAEMHFADGITSRGVHSAQDYTESVGSKNGIHRAVVMCCQSLYGMRGNNLAGEDIDNCAVVPSVAFGGTVSALGARLFVSGTGTITNSFGYISSGSVTEGGNVQLSTYDQDALVAALPNLLAPVSARPTRAEILARVEPAAAGALDGKGPFAVLTLGTENDEYVIDTSIAAVPTLSGTSAAASGSNGSGAATTSVAKGFMKWAIVPSGSGFTAADWKDLVFERLAGALEYTETAEATATEHTWTGSATLASGNYDLLIMHFNGWSQRSALTTEPFTIP